MRFACNATAPAFYVDWFHWVIEQYRQNERAGVVARSNTLSEGFGTVEVVCWRMPVERSDG